MKGFLPLVILLLTARSAMAQALDYYLPTQFSYDPSVPQPKSVIGHEVGEWHVTHDRLVQYLHTLAAAAPDRVKLETMGQSYEGRPQVLLLITSAANHARLEEIRRQHVRLTDPAVSGQLPLATMPAVVWIGHSIHGNEPSGSNAALLTAYHLAAARGKQIDDLLENVVVLLDPSFNPDGMQRFSTWANQHRSKNLVSDPFSREFNEVWPGGRFNHYWFDLNRDWLPSVHVESQNRLRWFHEWKPNILTDHHEQGSNATFFFQPGVPSRVNPLTPEKNQELTDRLAAFHARALDRIGSLYFTKENYDDFYYGKGSTYPDVQGCVGILFEQASSRGHLQQTANGPLSFPFTIRNQFVTALSTLEGALALRTELLEYQRDFFRQASVRAASYSVKGYVFGDRHDEVRNRLFIDMLRRHRIAVHRLPESWNDPQFPREHSWVVSLNQPQHSLIRAIFEKTLQYRDSLFYDITSWTMPLAFGIPFRELSANILLGPEETAAPRAAATLQGASGGYAYLIRWEDYQAPAALYELLKAGLLVKAATAPFELKMDKGPVSFSRGTLVVPVQLQPEPASALQARITALTEKYQLQTWAVSSGMASTGIDLGSGRFAVVTKPAVAMITGAGVNPTDAGEVWHLLDQRMNIPASHLEPAVFNRSDVGKYNTLILVGGNYSDMNKEKLKAWVQAGGVLILTEEAVSWAAQNGISEVRLKKARSAVDSSRLLPYAEREQIDGSQQVQGAIFGAQMDPTHPLAYGYTRKTLSLFKGNRVFLEKSRNPFATPFYYGSQPLETGWVSAENLEAIRQSAAVVVTASGNGRIIHIADNPNFRAFWLGGSKLFLNALFFGRLIEPGSARTGD
ncbi:MAG: hypothetical protein RJA57_144 [Bacteroidota bacterium]